jgi:hypothetical protein
MSQRTKEDRYGAVGKAAAGGGALGAIGMLLAARKKGLSPKALATMAGQGALSGSVLGGAWKGGTEIGGALDDDDYTGRVLGGLVGGGPVGAGLSALDTFLLKRKMRGDE